MSEQEQTPLFKVPVVPLCVDADLLALPPDTWVHVRNVSCADMGSGSCKAADAIAEIQRTMARQAKGNFTMTEVADVLAAANSFDAYRFLTIEMRPAARAGALTLTNPEFGGPLVGRDSMEFHDWVTPANLDAWLERAGFPFRWPLKPEPQAATPAPAKPLQRGSAQDAMILTAIRKAGHNPLALPVNEPGKAGVKAEIRNALRNEKLLTGSTVFDKAWERLRKQGDIADTD